MTNFLDVLAQSLVDPALMLGHVTYLLFFFSMLMRDIAWLRALAIAASAAKIVYRLYVVYDPVTVFWEAVLIALNLGQLALIRWENRPLRASAEERLFLDVAVPGLSPAAARALLKSGAWADMPAGTILATEGQPLDAVIFIAAGHVRIERGGQQVALCSSGDFIGEMSYASRIPASASATSIDTVRQLSFERARLDRVMRRRPVLRFALQAGFNRNLIEKLRRSNEGLRPTARPA